MSAPALKALLFDVYGTLLDPISVETTAREIVPEALDFVKLWRAKQLEYSWLLSLMGQYRSFWELTSLSLAWVVERNKLTLHAYQYKQLIDSWLTVAPFPDVLDGLQNLKAKGLRLAALSNGNPEMLEKGLSHSGVLPLLDTVLSVEAAGIFKPSPKVYGLALEWLGTDNPSEIGFVSSNSWDAIGATAFGFKVFWINRTRLPLDPLGPVPAAEISSFGELVSIDFG
jgi:2-haloacid dehalogenase